MQDEEKTRAQLIEELTQLRQRLALLESNGDERKQTCDALLDSPLQGIAILHEGRFAFVNLTLAQIVGYSIQELLNMSVNTHNRKLLHPDDYDRVQQHFQDRLVGKSAPSCYEFRIIRKDGALRWLEQFVSPITYQEKPGFLVVVTDITDRKQAEEALQENEERFRKIVNALPQLIAYTDRDLIYRFVNTTYEEVFQVSAQNILGRSLPEIIGEAAFAKAWPHVQRVLQGETVRYYECYEYASGNTRHIDGYLIPDSIPEGTVRGYYAVLTDISLYKEAEEALKLDEERLSSLLRLTQMRANDEKALIDFALEEGVRLTNSQVGYFHFVQPDAINLSLFTWSKAVLEQCSAPKMSHYPLDKAGIWADAFRERKPVIHNDYQHLEHKQGYPEGHVQIARHLSVPIFNGEQIVAIACVGNKELPYDDADARQLSLFMNSLWEILKNKRAEERIKASLREKEILLHELYHRTRNNMQIISSLLALEATRSSNEEVHHLAHEARQRIRAMSLVHQKLYESHDLSRIYLRDYVTGLLDLSMQSYWLSAARITFNLDIEDIVVLVDTAIPVGLVLNELISNTLQHAFPDGRTGEISLQVSRKDEQTLEIVFADDGVGVPEGLDFRAQATLGLELIFTLVEQQLKGEITYNTQNGLTWHILCNTSLYSSRV